jgi:hypothetical protein
MVELGMSGGTEQALVAPHSPHGGSRGLGGYSYMIITWFVVVQVLSNETVEPTKQNFLKMMDFEVF